jgi:hypothetical protein
VSDDAEGDVAVPVGDVVGRPLAVVAVPPGDVDAEGQDGKGGRPLVVDLEDLLDAAPINTTATYVGDSLFVKLAPIMIEKVRIINEAGAKPEIAVYTDADVSNADRFLIRSGLIETPAVWLILPALPGCSPMENPRQMIEGLTRTAAAIKDVTPTPSSWSAPPVAPRRTSPPSRPSWACTSASAWRTPTGCGRIATTASRATWRPSRWGRASRTSPAVRSQRLCSIVRCSASPPRLRERLDECFVVRENGLKDVEGGCASR